MTFKTADLFDDYGNLAQVCDPIFRDFGGRLRFAGPIATVKCFEDNSLVKSALAEPGQGRVLVVDAGGSLRCAMLGDMIAASAVKNGWNGVLMFGCVRDSVDIAGMELGEVTPALGVSKRRAKSAGKGSGTSRSTSRGSAFAPASIFTATRTAFWFQPRR